MFLTQKRLDRRTALKGIGVSVALPMLEAMMPARSAEARQMTKKLRFVAIEMVHGCAGSTAYGEKNNLWAPPEVGHDFSFGKSSLVPLENHRQHLTIVSRTDVRNAEAFTPPEIGGDHFRSAAVFLTQAHPHQTQGSDVKAGVSIDQIFAREVGHETPIPSMQLCIESVDQAGGCFYGYSCAYTDSISWASPNEPLPMIRDPRAVFDQLFGIGATPEARARRRRKDKSILDWVTASVNELKASLGAADQARLMDYLDDVREIERRIQKVEESNTSGEPRELPGAPAGVPDNYTEHVKLMFDLQALAFASDTTRTFAFKMSRDVSNRVWPETGVTTGFHIASHHGDRDERISDYAKINTYHVSLLPYFLDKLAAVKEGDQTLLDNSVVLYGSPMGNSNVHNHKRCPLILLGHGAGAIKGNVHLRAGDGTPMANPMLSVLHTLGVDTPSFGDSTGTFDLNEPAPTTAAALRLDDVPPRGSRAAEE